MTPKIPQAPSDRREFLSQVEHTLRGGKNSTILGGLRFGKTFLAKEIQKRLSGELLTLFLDLDHIALTPENFSLELIAKAIAQGRGAKKADIRLQDTTYLLSLEKEMGKDAFSHLSSVQNELQKIKPDQRLLVQSAFSFCVALASYLKKKAIVIADNAEHFLELNNFSRIDDVFSLLTSQKMTFLFASSAILEMKKLGSVEHFLIPALCEGEVETLVKRLAPRAEKKDCQEIMRLSRGHPHVARILAAKLSQGIAPSRAFADEILSRDGALFRYGEDAFAYYYSRARGQTLIKLLLRTVAQEELRLSDLARKIYRSAPVTKSLLERLITVDAIEKRGKVFMVCDPLLGIWLKSVSEGKDVDDISEIDERTAQEVARGS